LLSGTQEHTADLSSQRHQQHTREEKQHNMQGKVNISSRSSHNVSAVEKRDDRERRNNSRSSHVVTDRNCHQNDSSFRSKRKHHSPMGVTNNRFRDSINGKQLATSHGHNSAHRRSSSTSSRINTIDVNSPVFQENLNSSALIQRMEKKLRWINSLPHNAYHHHTMEEPRGVVKTPIHRGPLISGSVEHNKKTPTSTMKHDGVLDIRYCIL